MSVVGSISKSSKAFPPVAIGAKQASAMFCVSVRSWERWNSSGKIPAPINMGISCRRWDREELLAWWKAGAPGRDNWEQRKRAM